MFRKLSKSNYFTILLAAGPCPCGSVTRGHHIPGTEDNREKPFPLCKDIQVQHSYSSHFRDHFLRLKKVTEWNSKPFLSPKD